MILLRFAGSAGDGEGSGGGSAGGGPVVAGGSRGDVPSHRPLAQSPHGRLLAGNMSKRIVTKMANSIEMSDLVDLIIRQPTQILHRHLRRIRPRRIRMRIITLPRNVINIHMMTNLHPHRIINKTHNHMLIPNIRRQTTPQIRPRPRPTVIINIISPLQKIRNPPDPTLRHRHPQLRKLPKRRTPQQIRSRIQQTQRRQIINHLDRSIRRRPRLRRRRTQMHTHHRPHIHTRLPQRIPIISVNSRQPQRKRTRRKRQRTTPQPRQPTAPPPPPPPHPTTSATPKE